MKKIFNLCLVALSLVVFSNCSKDDDYKANTAAEANFAKMYPQASGVKWSTQDNHSLVEFRVENKDTKAWFDGAGTWQLTETEIPVSLIPTAIKTVFGQSDYADWRIEDVDYIQRLSNEPFYVLEVEQGETEFDLYFLEDGTLIKAFADDDHENNYLPNQLPAPVAEYLAKKHPGYKLIDVDMEHGRIEVEFIEGSIKKDSQFSSDGTWIRTSSDLAVNLVPQDIMDYLSASQYTSYRIEEVELVEVPNSHYYTFELESGHHEVDLRIHPDGRLEVVEN